MNKNDMTASITWTPAQLHASEIAILLCRKRHESRSSHALYYATARDVAAIGLVGMSTARDALEKLTSAGVLYVHARASGSRPTMYRARMRVVRGKAAA